jgi:microcystin-dependent protein
VFDNFADMNGAMIAFVPHTTNGATVTLNVDGLGAKPLRSAPSVELPAGVLVQGTPYVATYNNSDAAWYLQGFTVNPFVVPIGGLIPYVGASAPNSSFVLPFGQAISRTTYAALFSLVSTTFGSGDGSTTFNVPDLRGRAVFGLDNMGGSAASRITSAGGNFDATVLGGTQDRQNKTVGTANVPALTFAGTSQTWTINQSAVLAGVVSTHGAVSGADFTTFSSGAAQSLTVTVTPAGTVNNGSANTALPIIPPAMALPYILRII